jgi:LysM repeat protein
VNVASRGTGVLLWLSLLGLAGCLPVLDPGSEEKNPLIGDARAQKAAYNFAGAVKSLEKALEGNPRLALAHWELGLIFCQNVIKPAAAIYHFEKLLELRPDWRQAETARQLINASKIELAKTVPLGPQTPALQQQMDRLTGKVHELTTQAARLASSNQTLQVHVQQLAFENGQLRDRLAAANAPAGLAGGGGSGLTQPARPAPAAQPAAPAASQSSPARPTSPGGGPTLLPAQVPAATSPAAPARGRTHVVRSGETLSRIAQRHGVKLRDLVTANPNVRPERLKPGQTLRVP